MKSRLIQIVCVLLAGGLMVAGGTIQEGTRNKAEWNVLLGGVNAWWINYEWYRAQEDKQNGRYFDALQRAERICNLQPRVPDVWTFHSWNMAWNISVMTHTPQERWQWVTNGMKLLRDRGIPQNPKALLLYKELAWIYFFKMGDVLDDMHVAYKQRWAAEMQRLLGAPPYGTTQTTIDAFKPIAAAPLDRDVARQGVNPIQRDVLEKLLTDNPAARTYADLLAARNVTIGRDLLNAWNRFSRDAGADAVRVQPPVLATAADRELYDLINAPQHAQARNALLAFARAQLLWNEYRMDPRFMVELMERYGPLDWRLTWPHGIYWVSKGLRECEVKNLADFLPANTIRVLLNSLKDLTWYGRLSYMDNPTDPESPRIMWFFDWRYIEPADREYRQYIDKVRGKADPLVEETVFGSAHKVYLTSCIQMLYAGYKRDLAAKYFEELQKTYHPKGPQWEKDLDAFVKDALTEGGRPIPEVAMSQCGMALETAMLALTAGDHDTYRGASAYAQVVFNAYQKEAPPQRKFPPFETLSAEVLARVLVEPRVLGYYIPLVARSELYGQIGLERPRLQTMVFDTLAKFLPAQCKAEGMDFSKAFPTPPDIEEYRRKIRESMTPASRDPNALPSAQ